MNIIKEFKAFAMRGNVVDMAVGVIIGGAFGKIVSSVVGDLLMPPIGKLMGGVNFSDLFLSLEPGKTLPGGEPIRSLAQAKQAGVAVVAYGQFLNYVLDFIIVAACVFALVKLMNTLVKNEPPPPADPTHKDCKFCLMSIPIKATRCGHCTSQLAAFLLGLFLLSSAASARAEDYTGRWGVGGSAGYGLGTGSRLMRDTADNGVALGGWLRYGLSSHWQAALSYENVNLAPVRFEPITVSALYQFHPERRWTPTAELGVGGSRVRNQRDSSGNETSLTLKAGLGLDYNVCPNFVAGLRSVFYHAGHTSTAIRHEVDAMVLGAGLTYWFGGKPAPRSAVKPAPVVARAPAPAPAPKATPAPAARAPEPAKKKVSIALDVQFETAKHDVRPQYEGRIKEAADFLKAHPQATAEIEGHTDNVGSEKYNTALSQRRADAVRAYLVERFGVAGARLTAKGYGPSKPIADNATAAGRTQNRRVVATFDAAE